MGASLCDLPDDVLLLVFERCGTGRTLAALDGVCTRFRKLTKLVPTHIHVTPKNETRLLRWAASRPVTKVCCRRIANVPYFPTARIVDCTFASIRYRALPPGLQRVRLHRLCCPHRDRRVFKLSTCLPDSVVDVDITFEACWWRVDVDRSVPKLALRTHPPDPKRMQFRGPDFLVTRAHDVVDLTLVTYGGITVVPHVTTIRRAMIDCEDNFDVTNILRMFDRNLDRLVMRVPDASILWSQDLAHLDPVVVAISCDFVGMDAYGPRLRDLELDVDRLAYVPLPPRIQLNISVRNTYVDASFFT